MDERAKYKHGEVVWVQVSKRLGWWPAVVENLKFLNPQVRPDVTDNTIAVVKYFNEDKYSVVEDRETICPYNSSDKDQYISLGMSKIKHLNYTHIILNLN